MRHSPSSLATVNYNDSNYYFSVSREVSYSSVGNSYFVLVYGLLKSAMVHANYVGGDDICLERTWTNVFFWPNNGNRIIG